MRVGVGYDLHPLVPGRPLVLGGVQIPAERGLAGHSDADVLCHAIVDALLGAAGLGDIGEHFPSSDPRFAGASSLTFLERTAGMLRERNLSVSNVDASVVLEEPSLTQHRGEMRARIATALGVEPSRVSVKATTADGLGAIGRGEGAAALAVVLVEGPSG
jgi:2-C-methyl-D-erythritol 2,4-cyclodiphosphate synthase